MRIFKTKNTFYKKYLITIALLSFSVFWSQNTSVQDTVKKGINLGKIDIPNPKSVLEGYTYDPEKNVYIYTQSVDGFNINYPLILTPKQYEELRLKEFRNKYFKEKLSALSGKDKDKEEKKNRLLPIFYVNNKFFESIFGGTDIDIKPTGSVEIDLGVRYSKQDNPSFSPQNQSNFAFDFNQRISVGLQGKIGTRVNVNVNYDTQSTFAFQNLIKLDYAPTEDDIIQKIELGNVSFPLSNSLIRGAQSLFGVKTDLKFGRTTISGVFSEQRSQPRTVNSQGGGTVQEFDFYALDYDNDKHYFLSQYFRNNYDKSLITYPVINSRVQITRIEVWITNRQNRVGNQDNNYRNIVALQDLGETKITNIPDNSVIGLDLAANPTFLVGQPNSPTDNTNNLFNPLLIGTTGFLNQNIRDVGQAQSGFNNSGMVEGQDYSKLENARKLQQNEFSFHPQLGYISLNQRLQNDEILAVAYQYKIGDDVYQVGEFATDGVDATQTTNIPNTPTLPITQALVLKLLKGSLINVEKPLWNLMMKNIYQIQGASQLQQNDFRFNIFYQNPSPLNYITQSGNDPLPASVADTPLLRVLNLDKLNFTNDPQPNGDGFFDFIPGLTVDPQYGRIIFTSVEPFGKFLFDRLKLNSEDYNVDATYNSNQQKYVYKKLYASTQAAALQEANKNLFRLKGTFKSQGGDGIPLGAFNVPQGSVVVTAGGRLLVEGIDYTVNYQAGRVNILDQALLASNTPIQVSLENNAVFGQQTRRFYGINVEHKFSEKFVASATMLKLSERPFTQKADYNQESVNNTIVGFATNYSTELPFLTRWVNKLPNIKTEVPSNLSFRGEFAYLFPNAPDVSNFNNEPTSYIDDFEGSQSSIDLKSPFAWTLSSTPIGFGNNQAGFSLQENYRRARLNWYTIDPIFYQNPPTGINNNTISSNKTRRIFSQELFPNIDIAQGQTNVLPTLDLTYYPNERGPYNYNPNATNNTFPQGTQQQNWGGIVRSINTTNFEQSNVEYIQFWIMDPYTGNDGDKADTNNTGTLSFNLGEISEDVLKDGRKLYENGLPGNQDNQQFIPSIWGIIPIAQSLIYAFDNDEANRILQDAGLDGLLDVTEKNKFPNFSNLDDPSADNYEYYLAKSGGILERYKNYNNTQSNSPISVTDTNRGSTTLPDTEDANRDNTMNTIDAYYKFNVSIKPNAVIGQDYITDIRESVETLANGQTSPVKWIQYKIPILEAGANNKEGPIQDFRSIRFMRMYLTGFSDQITLRFGTLDLIRGEWRRYLTNLDSTDPNIADDDTGFDVTSVNIQENNSRLPFPYVTPPGVEREQLVNNNTVINQNEQALSLRVYQKNPGSPGLGGLEKNDSRGVFKNVNIDMRQYKKLRMFLHAEALPIPPETQPLKDNEMVAFIRFGNDFTENFYQIDVPLKVSTLGDNSPQNIWPAENELEIPLAILTQLKSLKLNGSAQLVNNVDGIAFLNESALGSANSKLNIGIKGNPNFGLVRTLMLGLKNPNSSDPLRGEVWFNELRMSDIDNQGGWAAVANMDSQIADFANLSATGKYSSVGFGSLDQAPNERSRESLRQFDIVTNVNLGKLLPNKWKINLPFNYGIGEQLITPKFDPLYQDVELNQILDNAPDDARRAEIERRSTDYTKRTSLNFIGVKKERAEKQVPRIYDIENFTLSYSFNEMYHRDFQIQNSVELQQKSAVDYNYAFKPKPFEPFKKRKFFARSSYLKFLQEFNINLLPANISFSSNIVRQFNKQQFRLIDVPGIQAGSLYRRNYFFNYQYGVQYPLTKSLKLNYTATNANIVRNYFDNNAIPRDDLGIWHDYFNVGQTNNHNQQIVVNYDLPLNKIPFLSFVKSSYVYTGDYSFTRSSDAFATFTNPDTNITYQLGNTVQNAASHKLNVALGMDQLYKFLGLTLVKKAKPVATPVKPVTTIPKPGEKVKNTAPAKPNTERSGLGKFLIGFATMIKNVQVNYTQSGGTLLPGYLPDLGFFGTSKPTLGFVFGDQSDVRYEAARRGYLTNYDQFNQNFTKNKSEKLDYSAQVEPLPDFKIDINADKNFADNYSEQYDVSPNGFYNSRAPISTGNFSMSTILIKTSFTPSTDTESLIFERFKKNRFALAERLALDFYGTPNYSRDSEGYPVGFSKTNQQVLLPSFVSAYSGFTTKNVETGIFRDIPLPNWTIKYTGFMKMNWFKENFKRFSIQSGYRSAYSVNSFRTNINPTPTDSKGDFYAKILTSNVNLTEQFNPLVRLDFEFKNSLALNLELKRDRSMNLSFDNNLLTEVQGKDYVFGARYRIKNVTFYSRYADNAEGIVKSDIILRADVTFRDNQTIVRNLNFDNTQLGGGQNIWSIKVNAEYAFSRNLTSVFFYDHQFTKAVVSTSFPITNIRAGFTLRYNFNN